MSYFSDLTLLNLGSYNFIQREVARWVCDKVLAQRCAKIKLKCVLFNAENALDALVYTSSEKVEKADKTPCIISSVVRFTEDIEPTSNPDPTSASDTSTPVKVSARPNLRDHEENLHTKRACPRIGKVCYSRKASRGQKQQRMWKFSVLPSATQELSRRVSNPNSEEIFAALILQTKRIASDGWWDSKLQLPKHGLLFQPH